MFKGYRFVIFEEDNDTTLVAYKSNKNLDNEIEDATVSFYDSLNEIETDNIKCNDVVKIIMNSFNIEWCILKHTKFMV